MFVYWLFYVMVDDISGLLSYYRSLMTRMGLRKTCSLKSTWSSDPGDSVP